MYEYVGCYEAAYQELSNFSREAAKIGRSSIPAHQVGYYIRKERCEEHLGMYAEAFGSCFKALEENSRLGDCQNKVVNQIVLFNILGGLYQIYYNFEKSL